MIGAGRGRRVEVLSFQSLGCMRCRFNPTLSQGNERFPAAGLGRNTGSKVLYM